MMLDQLETNNATRGAHKHEHSKFPHISVRD